MVLNFKLDLLLYLSFFLKQQNTEVKLLLRSNVSEYLVKIMESGKILLEHLNVWDISDGITIRVYMHTCIYASYIYLIGSSFIKTQICY